MTKTVTEDMHPLSFVAGEGLTEVMVFVELSNPRHSNSYKRLRDVCEVYNYGLGGLCLTHPVFFTVKSIISCEYSSTSGNLSD